jgi:hypothetical protein
MSHPTKLKECLKMVHCRIGVPYSESIIAVPSCLPPEIAAEGEGVFDTPLSDTQTDSMLHDYYVDKETGASADINDVEEATRKGFGDVYLPWYMRYDGSHGLVIFAGPENTGDTAKPHMYRDAVTSFCIGGGVSRGGYLVALTHHVDDKGKTHLAKVTSVAATKQNSYTG